MTLDNYAPHEPLRQCEPFFDDDTIRRFRPGVYAFREWVIQRFGGRGLGVGRACAGPPTSKHHESRAWDWGPKGSHTKLAVAEWQAKAKALIDELLADGPNGPHELARRFGLRTIIFDRKIYNAKPPHFEARDYTKANAHTTHIHFGFSRDGAEGKTTGYESKGGWPAVVVPLLLAAALVTVTLALTLSPRQRSAT